MTIWPLLGIRVVRSLEDHHLRRGVQAGGHACTDGLGWRHARHGFLRHVEPVLASRRHRAASSSWTNCPLTVRQAIARTGVILSQWTSRRSKPSSKRRLHEPSTTSGMLSPRLSNCSHRQNAKMTLPLQDMTANDRKMLGQVARNYRVISCSCLDEITRQLAGHVRCGGSRRQAQRLNDSRSLQGRDRSPSPSTSLQIASASLTTCS